CELAMIVPEMTGEELAVVLDGIAADVLSSADYHQPPVDAALLAERIGVTVAWDDRQPGRARRVQLAGARADVHPSILLRHDRRLERQHWALAHEIGESLAERAFAELRVDPREAPPQAREQMANRLAARLLLPRHWFASDGAACNWDLLAMKGHFSTASHELI